MGQADGYHLDVLNRLKETQDRVIRDILKNTACKCINVKIHVIHVVRILYQRLCASDLSSTLPIGI